MAYHSLSENFQAFFKRLNPDAGVVARAAREHQTVTDLIEDRNGPAAAITPTCFLQGSYKQETAIHDINDVDVVALCELWQPGSGGAGVRSWGRDEIFATIAAALQRSSRYAGKIEYGPQSMCIKVTNEIKVEVLPVVFASGNYDPAKEPFRLYRPERQQWDNGYARYHQQWLTWKNRNDQALGNFIPAIKVFKHLRTRFGQNSVSFHIECLLFRLANQLYAGGPADYLNALCVTIADTSAHDWYVRPLKTPCDDRDIFTREEWGVDSWFEYHKIVSQLSAATREATTTTSRERAIEMWQLALGKEFFPHL